MENSYTRHVYEAFPKVCPMSIHEIMAACPVDWYVHVAPQIPTGQKWNGRWVWAGIHKNLIRTGKVQLTAPDGAGLLSLIWEQQREWDRATGQAHMETWNQRLKLGLDP